MKNEYGINSGLVTQEEADGIVPYLNKNAELMWELITQTPTWEKEGNGGYAPTISLSLTLSLPLFLSF